MVLCHTIPQTVKKLKKLTRFKEFNTFINKSQPPEGDTEDRKMVSIREEANNYETPKTLNIADLDSVSVNIDIQTKDFTKEDGEQFSIMVCTVEDKEYRVPKSVLADLKAQLTANPKLENFKVNKAGEGLKTNYTVIPL